MKEAAIALNPDRIGHVYDTYTYEVSREKMREYAEATGISDPIYQADPAEVPLEGVVAPPTFAACFCLGRVSTIVADSELGAHWNLVHGSQAFTYHRPIRGGDVVRCTPWIVDITNRRSMDLLTYQIDCVDAVSDEPVVTSRSVIVFFVETAEGR